MEIKVTVELGDKSLNVIEKLLSRISIKPEIKPEKVKTEKVEEAVEAKPQKKDEPKSESQKKVEAKATESTTIESVRLELSKLAREKGASAAQELLAQFGATKLTDVPSESYSALLENVLNA